MSELPVLAAWRRAYALLGSLLVEGLNPRRLAAARQLPGLAEYLPADVDLDALAAEHYSLLGHELLPFAGVLLGEQGLVGEGAAAEVLRAAHAAMGIACPDEPSPDHLGQALRLMALLVDAQQQAVDAEDDARRRTAEQWQRRVLDEALLPWMPPVLAAVDAQPSSLWTAAVQMAVGVLARHRVEGSGLEPPAQKIGLPLVDASSSTSGPNVLDQPQTGLATIAEVLTTPSRSGVLWARRELVALARDCELPCGFGARRGLLEALLRAAAEYGAIGRVVEGLSHRLAARDEAYAAMEQEPGLGPFASPWRGRVAVTLDLMARLAANAPEQGMGTSPG